MIGTDKLWVPGPGEYSVETKKDIGNEPRKLQQVCHLVCCVCVIGVRDFGHLHLWQWKTPMRRTTWHHRPTDAADVMYSSLMDLNSINSSVVKGERRYMTTMRKCLPRSPVETDSRRPKEKLKFKSLEVLAPVCTDEEVGPGKYPHERQTDIGNDKRRLQSWTTPIRSTNWWRRATDAPDGEALLHSSPFDRPSTNRCGGTLQQCWPQPEDEQVTSKVQNQHDKGKEMATNFHSTTLQGRPVTTGLFYAPLGSLSPTRKKGRAPATA